MNATCGLLHSFFSDCVSVIATRMQPDAARQVTMARAKETVTKLISQLTLKTDHITIALHHCTAQAKQLHAERKMLALKDKMLERRRLLGQLAKIERLKRNAQAQMDLIDNDEINQIFITAMRELAPKSIVQENLRLKVDDIVQDTQDSIQEVNEISNMLAQPIARRSNSMLAAGADDEATEDDLEQEFESLLSETESERNAAAYMAAEAAAASGGPAADSVVELPLSLPQPGTGPARIARQTPARAGAPAATPLKLPPMMFAT